MRYEIILSPQAQEDLRRLEARNRAAVRDALEVHLRHEPTKVSRSRIKRLRDLAHPQYRLQKHIGSNLDEFLNEEKLLDLSEAAASKRVIAFQIAQEMKRRNLSKSEMASRMKTSRPALERLLDPSNPSVTLSTLERAASALGKKLKIELA